MRGALILAGVAAICIGAGCQSVPEKHYPIQAEVISVDEPKGLITVKHGEIPGLMPAMTMSYMVAHPLELHTLAAGDKISAELVVSESKGRLEKIVVVKKAAPLEVLPTTQPTKTQ
jgi:Cu/Ag efflux protein CusF